MHTERSRSFVWILDTLNPDSEVLFTNAIARQKGKCSFALKIELNF